MSTNHRVVSRQEWLKSRRTLLETEKEYSRAGDRLAAARRELPWVKLDQSYTFETPSGRKTLEELFDGRSQLIVYHFMFAPEWSQGCPSCSLLADHFDPAIVHLNQKDVTMVVVSRAPVEKLEAFRKRMGWHFEWASAGGNDFNRDFCVSFTADERASDEKKYNYESEKASISDLPGMSVFYRDDSGDLYHTYSTYARGLDQFLAVYRLLDVTPKGRDENGHGMSWVRHHDLYNEPEFLVPWMEPAAAAQ